MYALLYLKLTELGYDFIALLILSRLVALLELLITKIFAYHIIHSLTLSHDYLYIEGEKTHPLLLMS